jgi:hypothetical protein
MEIEKKKTTNPEKTFIFQVNKFETNLSSSIINKSLISGTQKNNQNS